MDCEEFMRVLDELVDSELAGAVRDEARQHLNACRSCQTTHQESVQIKRLVQRKTFQLALPGGLAARVLQQIRRDGLTRSRRRLRTTLLALAAVALAAASVWIAIVSQRRGGPPLAHAAAMREVARRYEEFRRCDPPDHGILVGDPAEALRQIRRSTGIDLVRFPRINGAEPVCWKPQTLLGKPCVRLSYRNIGKDGKACGGPPILIYAFAAGAIEHFHTNGFCNCIRYETGNIYCVLEPHAALSVVSALSRQEIAGRIASLAPAGGGR